MAANTTPIFPSAPNIKQSQVTVANTNRDGTGTTVTVWTPGTNGSLLVKIIVQVPGTASADMIRFFWNDGSVKYLYKELAIAANTPSNTVPVIIYEIIPDTPEVYKSGWTLLASTNSGQATNILVLGADY